MPTESLSLNVAQPLTTNKIYALPINKVVAYSDTVSPTLEQSNNFTFATKAAVVFNANTAQLHAAFVRATSGNPVIILKKG